MDVAGLVGILTNTSSTEFQKAKACMRAGELAKKEAVPALAALLADEKMAMYARYGLEPIKDSSADDALRAAMGKLKGNLQIGVINSIAKRRDAKAIPALAKLMYGTDAEVARASASALGHVGGPAAMKELQAAMVKATGMVKMAVGDACLVCAERLLEDGKRDMAMTMYASLTGPETPKPIRLAAMNGIIREETSLTRPR